MFLGGILGIDKAIKEFNSVTDLNNINGVGFKGYDISTQNIPRAGFYGIVLQLANTSKAISGAKGSWLFQLCFETESDMIFYRKRINNRDWGNWYEIMLRPYTN